MMFLLALIGAVVLIGLLVTGLAALGSALADDFFDNIKGIDEDDDDWPSYDYR